MDALHNVNIVPPQHDIPIVSEVTNQVRQYLEKLIVIALNKTANVRIHIYLITSIFISLHSLFKMTPDKKERNELTIQTLEEAHDKIELVMMFAIFRFLRHV